MAENVSIDAVRREVTGKKVKTLRREGMLPAVIYGAGIEPTSVVLNLREATNKLRTVTSATQVDIHLGDDKHTALVRERQFDVIKRELIHIDFLAISMDETLRASVPLRLIGEAPAVDEYGAMIIAETDSLEVEALPRDLPEAIEVDISSITELGSTVTIGDLVFADGVTVLDSLDTVIAVAVTGAIAEVEEEEVEIEEELLEGAEPEVIEKGKKEEEEEE